MLFVDNKKKLHSAIFCVDAHCKWNTPPGPSLGYDVSGQAGSTRCFKGSERFMS